MLATCHLNALADPSIYLDHENLDIEGMVALTNPKSPTAKSGFEHRLTMDGLNGLSAGSSWKEVTWSTVNINHPR